MRQNSAKCKKRAKRQAAAACRFVFSVIAPLAPPAFSAASSIQGAFHRSGSVFKSPHLPPQRFVCSHQTIVCCRQTIVCSHQTMVCCRQTTKRLDGGKRKRGGSAPDTVCRAANFTLLFRNTIKGTKWRELNARQTSEKHPKGHD